VIRHSTNSVPIAPDILRGLLESPLALFFNSPGAVQLFFVLSGFALCSSLDRPHGNDGLVRRFLSFAAKRSLRIYLPFLAAVLMCWVASFAFIPSVPGPS
jgi:peptidoglycan/LPS O-acetylase OafA/YrhL